MTDAAPLDLFVVEDCHPEWGWEFVDWYRTREGIRLNPRS